MHNCQTDDKTRHDRLFELIRQENITDHILQKSSCTPKSDTESFSNFINEAEHSLQLS